MQRRSHYLSVFLIVAIVFVFFGGMCLASSTIPDNMTSMTNGCASQQSNQNQHPFCVFSLAATVILSGHDRALVTALHDDVPVFLAMAFVLFYAYSIISRSARKRLRKDMYVLGFMSRYLKYLFSRGILHPKLF